MIGLKAVVKFWLTLIAAIIGLTLLIAIPIWIIERIPPIVIAILIFTFIVVLTSVGIWIDAEANARDKRT
jgi:thiol:disulfide interchange protein